MADREKVIKDLEFCVNGHFKVELSLATKILALLKEDCHNCKLECLLQRYDELKEKYDSLLKEQEHKDKMFHALEEDWKRLKELLKEQETGHWIYLENCSNSGVYCSECHTKVFDNYPFKKKFSYFCPHCGTRMEGETERR